MATSINDKILSSISTKSDTMDKSLYKTTEVSDNGFNDIFDNIQQKSRETENKLNLQEQNNTDNKYSQEGNTVENSQDERISSGKDSNDFAQDDNSVSNQSQDVSNETVQSKTDDVKSEITTEEDTTSTDSNNLQVKDENVAKNDNSDKVQVKEGESEVVADSQKNINSEVEDVSLTDLGEFEEPVIKQDAASVILNDEISSDSDLSSEDSEASDGQNEVVQSEVTVDSEETSNILTAEDLNLDFDSKPEVIDSDLVSPELTDASNDSTPDILPASTELEGSVEFVSVNKASINNIEQPAVDVASQEKNAVNPNELNKNIVNEEAQKVIKDSVENQKVVVDVVDDSELTTKSSGLQISISDEAKVSTKNVTASTSEDTLEKDILKQNIINELKAEISESKKDLFGEGSFNSQNASEQVIKLSLNGSLDSSSSDFSNLMTSDSLSINSVGKSDMSLNQVQSAPTTISKTDILTQITDKLNSTKIAGGEKIEMLLKPESLGKVNVQLQSNKGQITATIVAESATVKEVLEKNIETLKNNLASQGVQLNNVTVKVQETEKAFSGNLDFAQDQFDNFEQQQKNSEASGSENYEQGEFVGNLDSEMESEELVDNNNESEMVDSQTIGLVNYKI